MKKVSKGDFERYEEVRLGGSVNMLDAAVEVLACISKEVHLELISNYGKYREMYGNGKDDE